MAMKSEDIEKALDLLSQFERQAIDPKLFGWDYLVEHVGFSRATLWRNNKIKIRLGEVRDYLEQVSASKSPFTHERIQRIKIEQNAARLKEKNQSLESEVEMLREVLAYAASVAVAKNLDPQEFFLAPKRRRLKNG